MNLKEPHLVRSSQFIKNVNHRIFNNIVNQVFKKFQIFLFIIFNLEQMDSLMPKTFVFENQISSKTENLEIQLRSDTDTIDINHIINIWKHKNSVCGPIQFKVYDPEINRYVLLDNKSALTKLFVYSPVIMIKYKEIVTSSNFEDDVLSISSSKASSESKRQRNKQRTIQQVLQHVKLWRQIHNTLDKHKNKINLQDAAKIVGISKKSLDDYYCQLRLAEQYGFDFQGNMSNKIGILRTFVKQHRPKGDQGIKHERLPKKLRILEQIKHQISKDQYNQDDKLNMEQQQPAQTIIQCQYQPPLAVIPEDQYENRFYNSFHFMLDQPQDPFMMNEKKNLSRDIKSQFDFFLF